MIRALALFLALSAPPPVATHDGAGPKPGDPGVTVLDLSAPDEPESEFPTIVRKGSL